MNPIVNVEKVNIEIDIEDNCNICCPCLPPITKRKYTEKEVFDKKVQEASKDVIDSIKQNEKKT